jgi:hypothetical protein
MRYIENRTNADGFQYVKFIPRTTEDSYLRIFNGPFCGSSVSLLSKFLKINQLNLFYLIQIGKMPDYLPQPQALSLSKRPYFTINNCITLGSIVHLLMHTLGFWHEHSRLDRDNYITINWDNIECGFRPDFTFVNGSDFGTSYDIYSIMHFDSFAFSSNGKPTIVPKDPKIGLIKEPQSLTDTDVEGIRFLYKSSTTRPTTTTPRPTTTTTRPTTTTPRPTTTTTRPTTTTPRPTTTTRQTATTR